MTISRLYKIGYFLIGFGTGVFISSLWYKHKQDASAYVEDYVYSEDDNDDKNASRLENDSPNNGGVSEQGSGIDPKRVSENKNGEPSYLYEVKDRPKTEYSKMYFANANNVAPAPPAKRDILEDDITADYSGETEEDEDEFEDNYVSPDLDLPRERVSPFIEIFADENPQEFVSLIYYAGDETLSDDTDQLIPNASEVVGQEALGRLLNGGRGVINGVIYVRNVKTHINYEVTLDSGSYSQKVLNLY